jgi:hypothetical protein
MTSEAAWTKAGGGGGGSILFGGPKAHPPRKRVDRRDLLAGGLLILFGAGTIAEGLNHPIGTLRQMGSGFFPVALGVILVVLGLVIAAVAAIPGRAPGRGSEAAFVPPDWRGFFAIVSGIIAFIVLGAYFGLAPAAFGLVFISAMGDRSATLKSALVLALAMTAVATILFWYLLQIQFPLLRW